MKINITTIQADIIFKALHYTARTEGISIPEGLTEVFEVLAEYNPQDTDVAYTVEVMEYLTGFIKSSESYSDHFNVDDDEEDEAIPSPIKLI